MLGEGSASHFVDVPRGTSHGKCLLIERTERMLCHMPHKTIEIIARGVLVHDDSLLLCRNRKRGYSFLPGGHVDFGEPAREALEREVREELGAGLLADRFLGAMEASFTQPKADKRGPGRRHHEVNLVFQLSPPPAGPSFEPGALRSQEKHIEFIWEPMASLMSEQPSVQVLPVGMLELIIATSQLSSPDTGENWRSQWQ